jgi:hypothetical protein
MRSATLSLLVLLLTASQGFSQFLPPPVPLQKAVTIAQKGIADSTFLYSRIEYEDGTPLWGLYFLRTDGSIVEKELNGNTGAILATFYIPKIDPTVPSTSPPPANSGKVNPQVVNALQTRAQTKLPAVQYIDIAIQKNAGGVASGYQVQLNNDQLQVKVSGSGANGSSNWQVTMDMASGRIVNR